MSGDQRGFVYPLEPLRRRQRWQLDALQARLATAQGRLDTVKAESARIEAALTTGAQTAAAMTSASFDPQRHQAALAYLSGLHVEVEQQAAELKRVSAERDLARAECVAQQRRNEATERHREQYLEQYKSAERNREMTEADSDWIARSAWRVRAMGDGSVSDKEEDR
jgi:flagellar export protein FliJ